MDIFTETLILRTDEAKKSIYDDTATTDKWLTICDHRYTCHQFLKEDGSPFSR